VWPSHEEAIKSARHARKHWDERVLQRWFKYGYRALPTTIYPQDVLPTSEERSQTSFNLEQWIEQRWPNGNFRGEHPHQTIQQPVTLATTKHQEVFSYLRPNFKGITPNSASLAGTLVAASKTAEQNPMPAQVKEDLERMQLSDVVGPSGATAPFYRAEPIIAHLALAHIRPSVLYIFGGQSPFSTLERRKAKIDSTGIGIGGSGGASRQKVKAAVIDKGSHLAPFEAVERCADAIAPWLGEVFTRWEAAETKFMADWGSKSIKERSTVSPEWVEKVKSLL
jgi:pimeloyl-ACP methyl ester carboxylesterase